VREREFRFRRTTKSPPTGDAAPKFLISPHWLRPLLAAGSYSIISFICLAVITGIFEFSKSFRFLVTIISILFSNAE